MAGPTDIKIFGADNQWHSLKGKEGPQGPPGPGIHMLGSKATEAELKQVDTTGLKPGDAYMTEDDGMIHVWDGKQFINTKIQGKEGKQGPQGKTGRSMKPFDNKTSDPPAIASKPDDAATEPAKAHVGDVWFEMPDSP